MHWIYLIHEFHNLSWITEINEHFHDILIYWDAPVNSIKTCRQHFLMLFPLNFSIRNIYLCDSLSELNINNFFIYLLTHNDIVAVSSSQTIKHVKTKRESVYCLFIFWICRFTSMTDWFLQFKQWILSWPGRKTQESHPAQAIAFNSIQYRTLSEKRRKLKRQK